ncbi:putative acetyltransferase [Gimesia alba]|uniref:Putative acetyltransferase n=1 Tax=Gimesia alba TaxID=2527973 RepID=A0A517RLM8_9PLAN|nr:GNAT family N-acetyltransferase [Gimesia alba]QDT44778.1 putative acetyltransferase [Gimesia alba]
MKTSSEILIREATSAEADEVAAVFEAAFAPIRLIYRPTAETLVRQADQHREETRLVAVIDEQVVATVEFDLHETYLHVLGLAVHPDFQRRGIAGCLLDWISNHAINLGRHTVVLETIKETGNVPLFEKLGFQVVDEAIASWCVSEIHEQLYFVTMERTFV